MGRVPVVRGDDIGLASQWRLATADTITVPEMGTPVHASAITIAEEGTTPPVRLKVSPSLRSSGAGEAAESRGRRGAGCVPATTPGPGIARPRGRLSK